MGTMQEMITGEADKVITGAQLAMVQAPQYANTGTLHAMRGVEPVLAIQYGFYDGYATISLSGPGVEQAAVEFLIGQDRLNHNRVCRGVIPMRHIIPGDLADRRGLTIQFHYLEYGKPGMVREFLDALRQLLPGPPEDGDYVVEWEIDAGLVAGHREAAQRALAIMQDPHSDAPIFKVRGPDGRTRVVHMDGEAADDYWDDGTAALTRAGGSGG